VDSEPAALFAYGTLLCADILEAVTGCRLQGHPASLIGFRRWSLQGEDYPAVVPEEGAEVRGLLYEPLPAGAWQRLDRFEGAMYARRIGPVRLADGGARAAGCYVLQPGERHRLADPDWSLERFRRSGRERFLRRHGL
jgi:gamma-glutamylcyclotransferase (GGCT)/AIG2-like uncharacterized protein YtfP